MRIFKGILFAVLSVIIGFAALKVFNYKDTGGGGGFPHLYQEKADIDVMFFGSSHAHCTIDHGYLWDQYGIAGYTLSAGSQNLAGTYYFVKEALRVQKPKVIMVECWGASGGEIKNGESDVYRNTLGMRWSAPIFEYLDYLANNMEMDSTWKNQVLCKIPIVHSRYTELTQSDFKDNIPFMRGYRGSFDIVSIGTPEAADNYDTLEIGKSKEEFLQKVIDVARENDVEVVFFVSPYYLTDEEQMQFNRVAEFAVANNVPFINFNHLYEEIGLDFEKDMRDESHVNNDGAVKVTEYLSQFLKEEYDISDRRGQAGYELWEQNALYLRNKELQHELGSAGDINEYLQRLSEMEEEHLTVLALTGNYNALGEVYLESLMSLGITGEEYGQGGLWIFMGKERIAYFPGKEYDYCLKTSKGEIHVESRMCVTDDGEVKESPEILVNAEDFRMVENGVNIVVYNEKINQLIDAAGDDIYLGLEMTHSDKLEEFMEVRKW